MSDNDKGRVDRVNRLLRAFLQNLKHETKNTATGERKAAKDLLKDILGRIPEDDEINYLLTI